MISMMGGVAHMEQMLQRSGPTARRDLRRAAPPVYAMARLPGLAKRHS